MEPEVIASVTSLVIAVFGFIVIGTAQRRSAERAHRNALDLFERQTKALEEARAEDARERRWVLHLDERRRLYARLPALVFKLTMLRQDNAKALDQVNAIDNTDAALKALDRALIINDKISPVYEELWVVTEEIRLVASSPVRQAATRWADAVLDETDPHTDLESLRRDFLSVARMELGADGPGASPGRP